jgi:hypothetical protein
MLIQRETTNPTNNHLCAMGLKAQEYNPAEFRGSCGFNFGYPDNEISAEVYNRNSTEISIQDNTTYFIVTRIQRDVDPDFRYNTSSIVVNPSTWEEPAVEEWTGIRNDLITQGKINLFNGRVRWMEADDHYIIDEIRIGTTYESVVVKNVGSKGSVILIR